MMPKYTIRVEVIADHSFTGEFANEQEAHDYAHRVCAEQDVKTTDGWNWDDERFTVWDIEEDK